jgi:hypothetical protein
MTKQRGFNHSEPSLDANHDHARPTTRMSNHEACPSPRVIAWDEWVAEDRAAAQLGTSVPTLRRMRALGKLPFTRMAGHVYYHPDDLAVVLAKGYGRTA